MKLGIAKVIAGPLLWAALVSNCGAGGEEDDAGVTKVVGQTNNLVATSPTHACAVRHAGLYCWGQNIAGELGTGDTMSSDVPIQAKLAGTDIVDVATNTGRTCVRRSTGEMACWGANDQGQIGDGTRNASLTPVPASGVQSAIAMAIDTISTCALRADHSVWCWGLSPASSPTDGSAVPTAIAGLTGITELKNGMMGSYCALDMQQRVWCWRAMDGTWAAPMELTELAGARTLALAAWNEVCVVASAGNVLCHDLDNGKTVPLERSESSVAVSAAGGLAACAKSSSGTWQCWNVLPIMLETTGSKPIEIRTDVPIRDLTLGGFRICALREDHSVGCMDAAEMISLMPQPEFAEIPLVQGLPL